MNNVLPSANSLATHLKGIVSAPISVRICVPLEPKGKPTSPLTKSSVKFCESKEAHQVIGSRTHDYRNILWIFLLHYFDKGAGHTHTG